MFDVEGRKEEITGVRKEQIYNTGEGRLRKKGSRWRGDKEMEVGKDT